MSTKTNFKRLALTVVVSLGIGLLSAVPSQGSIIGTGTVTAADGTATTATSDSRTAATLAVSFFGQATADTAVITLAAGSKPSGAATFDSSSVRFTALDTVGSTAATTIKGLGSTAAAVWTEFTVAGGTYGSDSATMKTSLGVVTAGGLGTAKGKIGVWLDTTMARTVGTYTIPYSVEFYSQGVLDTSKSQSGTLSIVVSTAGAAAAGAVSAAATSSAILYGGSSFAAGNTVDSTTLGLVNTPDGTADAVIRVVQKTAAGDPSRESITVTIDRGNVGDSTNGALGKSVTFVGNANGTNDINVYADGSSGLATITVKTTSLTFANKTLTWYSSTISSITVTKLGNTLGSASSNILLAVAKDSLGNVSQSDVYAVATDRTIIATTVTTGTTCSYSAVYGGNVCALSGATDGTTTVTVWDKNSAATRTVSGSASLTVSTKSAVAIKIATDKTTYAPGEVAYVRVWAVDASGNPVAPGTYTNLLASGGVTSTVATGNGSDTTTAITFDLGFTTAAGNGYASADAIKLYKVYMPYTGGDVTFKATGGTLLPSAGQVEVSAKASVTDNGAAALAAVTALASQVSAFITKINAQITTLTDLVMKIQKKVKA